MTKLKIDFIKPNAIDESKLIAFNAKSIQEGNYQKAQYMVLPRLIARNHFAVHFPDLGYTTQFWKDLQGLPSFNYGTVSGKNITDFVQSRLANFSDYSNARIADQIITQWQKIESEFGNLVSQDFPQVIKKIRKIEILITNFGTAGSFYAQKTKSGIYIKASHRSDMPLSNIAQTIVQSIYLSQSDYKTQTGSSGFRQRQASVIFLLKSKRYTQLLGDLNKASWSRSSKLRQESNRYLTALGFPPKANFKLYKGEIYLQNEPINKHLTAQEFKILSLLIHHRNEPVSYDLLAEELWGDDSDAKFSLFAIAKCIENLRNKLSDFGLNKKLISSVRSTGYYLID